MPAIQEDLCYQVSTVESWVVAQVVYSMGRHADCSFSRPAFLSAALILPRVSSSSVSVRFNAFRFTAATTTRCKHGTAAAPCPHCEVAYSDVQCVLAPYRGNRSYRPPVAHRCLVR